MMNRSDGRGDEVVLSASDVHKSFDGGRISVLRGVSLKVRAGESVALCGTSGSGKSTLLNILGGLDIPDTGTVEMGRRRIATAAERTWALRHTVGFVFQLHNLIPDLTLEENCLIPALATGGSLEEARERVNGLLEATGIAHRATRPVQQLSGGERQRAALCRALVNRPAVLLADEPTGSLDESNGAKVLELMFGLMATEATTLVVATHDRSVAEACSRLVVIRNGLIDHDG
jgi:ABC-type lipoprotein export system ATPase subunit